MQAKMVQLTSAVILCLCLFGQSVMAKPGYASGYDVDYYVSVSSACSAEIIVFVHFVVNKIESRLRIDQFNFRFGIKCFFGTRTSHKKIALHICVVLMPSIKN